MGSVGGRAGHDEIRASGALGEKGVKCARRVLFALMGEPPGEKVYGPAPRSRRAVREVRLAGAVGGCHGLRIFFGFFSATPVFWW